MVRINLLPVKVSRKKEAGKQQLAILVAVVVAAIGGNWFWSSHRADELKQRQAKLQRTREDIAQLERIIGEVRNIKEAQQGLQKKLDVLDKLKQGRTGPVRMLDELASITPRQVWLRKFEEKTGAVTFQGLAVSIDDVSEFMTKLKNSTYFSAVELKNAKAVQGSTGIKLVDFDISATARYSPMAEGAAAGPGGPGAPMPGKG